MMAALGSLRLPHRCHRKGGTQLAQLEIDQVEVRHGGLQREVALHGVDGIQQLSGNRRVVNNEPSRGSIEVLSAILHDAGAFQATAVDRAQRVEPVGSARTRRRTRRARYCRTVEQ